MVNNTGLNDKEVKWERHKKSFEDIGLLTFDHFY